MNKKQILGACARGYCTKGNKNKELDSTLIEAITEEILAIDDSDSRVESYNNKISMGIIDLIITGDPMHPQDIATNNTIRDVLEIIEIDGDL